MTVLAQKPAAGLEFSVRLAIVSRERKVYKPTFLQRVDAGRSESTTKIDWLAMSRRAASASVSTVHQSWFSSSSSSLPGRRLNRVQYFNA